MLRRVAVLLERENATLHAKLRALAEELARLRGGARLTAQHELTFLRELLAQRGRDAGQTEASGEITVVERRLVRVQHQRKEGDLLAHEVLEQRLVVACCPTGLSTLKAGLPEVPQHARALESLAEGVALWYGRPLYAALGVAAQDARRPSRRDRRCDDVGAAARRRGQQS